MAWLTSLPTVLLVSKRSSKERVYQYANAGANSRYSDRTFLTTTEEYGAMAQSTAETQAAGMGSDTTDGSGNRTVVTADVQKQNDAGAYKIVKTTAYTSAWTAWSAWNPAL